MNKFIFPSFHQSFFTLTASSQKGTKSVDKNLRQKEAALKGLDSKYDYYKERALQIWKFAEVGYKLAICIW